MRIRLPLFLLCWAACSLPLRAQTGRVAAGDYPLYVTFLPPSRIDSVLDYARTDLVPVIYAVNRHTLVPNAQTDSIVRLIDRIRHDRRVNLAYVWIGGSASPEGPADLNWRLGEQRAHALADYLRSTSLPDSLLRVQNLGEDWESVAWALRSLPAFPYRDRILGIIAMEPGCDARKQQISDLDEGRTWQRLIREVFPPFRNSRMVIVCYEEPPLPSPAPPAWQPPAEMPPLVPVPSTPQCPEPHRRVILLKTNALAVAAALVANIGFEVELAPHWSLDVPVYYSPYNLFKETRKVRVLATQPEVRYWFGQVSRHHFVGLHTHVAGFNVALNDHGRYQDPNRALWGMGLSYGYACPFGRNDRWGVEFTVGAGFADYKYDKYENIGIRPGQLVGSAHKHYWGVTRAGITLSYKWFIKKKDRRARR